MFEIRPRVLDARDHGPGLGSFLGVAERFPHVLVHTTTAERPEKNLVNAPVESFRRSMVLEATRMLLSDIPTVRVVRLRLARSLA